MVLGSDGSSVIKWKWIKLIEFDRIENFPFKKHHTFAHSTNKRETMAEEELDSYIATMQTSYKDIQPDKISVDPLTTTYDYCRPETTTPSPEFAVTDYFTTHEEVEKPPMPTVTSVPQKPVETETVRKSIGEVIKKRIRKPVNRDAFGYVEHPAPKARRRNSTQKPTKKVAEEINDQTIGVSDKKEESDEVLNQEDLAALDPTVSTFDDTMLPPLYEEPKTDTDTDCIDSSDDEKTKQVVEDQVSKPVTNGNATSHQNADLSDEKVTKKEAKKPPQRKKAAPKQGTTRRKSATKITIKVKTTSQSTQTDQLVEPVDQSTLQSTMISEVKETHRSVLIFLSQNCSWLY